MNGGGGIRTHGTAKRYTGFRVRPFQPLRHPSEGLSPPSEFAKRRSLKKPESNARDSSARRPDSTRARWFSRGSSEIRYKLRHAPVLGSSAPYTTRSTRLKTIDPAHIGHGSSVTYSVHPSSRQLSRVRPANVKASRSAWAVGSCSVSRKLNAWAITRSPRTITAPTGTSPNLAASRASARAWRIAVRSSIRHFRPRSCTNTLDLIRNRVANKVASRP